jgi:mRNA-degrading endonuclease toxin of MazEF toxin-antitoxin module
VVNCVAISSQLKESPVHVLLHMEKDSHIMCEQIFTVSKTELTDFMGNVPNSTLLRKAQKIT